MPANQFENDSAQQAIPTAAVPDLAAALPVSRATSSEQRLGLDVACAAAGQAELVPQKISTTGDDQVTTVLSCLLSPLHLTQFGSVDICHTDSRSNCLCIDTNVYAYPCNQVDN